VCVSQHVPGRVEEVCGLRYRIASLKPHVPGAARMEVL
jgi:hypothetical protein